MWIKGLVVGAILLAIGGTIYAGYRYVGNLQSEIVRLTTDNATLVSNNAQLEQGLLDQQETIASLQRDAALQGTILRDTLDNFQRARDQVNDLENKLGRHDLGFLAANRPGLVENIINNATENVARCFAIASGSPLTAAEESATLNSQINTECPDIANPNFRGSP